MEICGIYETYEVFFVKAGWSYAVPVVYVKRKFLLLFTIRKKVWEGKAISRRTAEKMHREPLLEWFKSAVNEYEEYKDSWN